eukprot:CAMPEP_0181381820 /NCGR_PEP_ID=MMETSP1106-20121128/20357_1 /TAXON_ID=81844 /ORGANISM="Mantoniella antarctica, Strain SL-175" /LENGTH=101 /DNA_ID=CAMNT_0023501093 /DNA_START=70 /DNA_END=372 /DNA_ORIENTATION=+
MGQKKTRKNQKEQEPVPQAAPLEQPQEEGKATPAAAVAELTPATGHGPDPTLGVAPQLAPQAAPSSPLPVETAGDKGVANDGTEVAAVGVAAAEADAAAFT